jgi:peptide/nickel transport system permease protein
MRRALRRLAFYALAAFTAVTLNFLFPRLMPGDPASALLARFQGQLQPEALAALREAFGFSHAPLHRQYAEYLAHVARGDLGISIVYFPAPVTSVISTGLFWTLLLAGASVLVSFALGSLLGAWAAWRRGGWLDTLLAPALVLVGAFPYFWLAMLALYVFGLELGWFPLRHAYDGRPAATAAFGWSVLRHLALPGACVVLASAGGWMLGMRNAMIGVLGEDYVRLAQAKGLPSRRIVLAYAARNALLPNVTALGMALGFVFSGSLLTEIVFSYPGLGYLLMQAVRGQDFPLMQGLFLIITFAVLGANLLVDLLYAWLDPRSRTRSA